MKILQMKLIAFGPFTDKPIDLGEGQEGLHIIYGPNEAGKSSALRALRQLLYGIPHNSPDDFIHPHPRLQIGGKLRRSDGTVLDLIRRKGRGNTLRAPDETTLIDESHLRTFLGGVDESLFATMFGIDHADLVRGGQEILQGKGNIGQILFAAGSGVSNLRKVQDELEVEAGNLFKPSGQKPPINKSITDLKKNQEDMRKAQLSGQEWTQHHEALREALHHKQSVDRILEQKRREQGRLNRINEALPIIGRRKDLMKRLEPYKDAVLLPKDFGDRRQKALTDLRIAEQEEKQASQRLEEIGQETEELDVPEPLIQHADLIKELHQELGSHQKALKDRSGLVVKRNCLQDDARAILRGLRGDLTLDSAEQLRLSRAKIVRIQELGNAHGSLVTQGETAEDHIDKLSRRMDLLKEQLTDEDPRDAGDLRGAIEHARQQGALEETYQEECQEIRRSGQRAEIGLKKLLLWPGTLDEIEELPVPSVETINLFERRLDDAEGAVEKLCAEIDEIDRAVVELDGQVEQLRLEQEVPTEDDLHEARRQRDGGWQFVRQAWIERRKAGKQVREFVAAFPSAKDLAEAYALSVRHADDLGDRLRREANRVARKATLLAERETLKNHHRRLEAQLEMARIELAKIEEEWSTLWRAMGISPRSPREMRAWAQDQAVLAQQVSAIREQKAKVDKMKARIETHRWELRRCLDALGGPPGEEDQTLAHLIEQGQQLIDHLDEIRSKRDGLLRELKQGEDDLGEARLQAEKAEQALSRWCSEWAEAIRPLGLGADASPAQANAVVQDLQDLFDKLKEADGLHQRIQDIGKDAVDFTGRVRHLTERIAPDLGELPVEEAVAELNTRLTQAQVAKEKQESLKQQGQREDERLRNAKSDTDKIHAHLAAMCEEAGCESYEELRAAEDRSTHRQQTQEQLDQQEEQLRNLSAGATIDEFIQDTQTVDPDTIAPMTDLLTEEIDQLDRQRSELDQTIGSEGTELRKMDGSARAAELAEDTQGLLARLETDVEQYVRFRLASIVLSQAIESYRQKNQDPILKQASDLFTHMTLGSFEGLRVDPNDRGEEELVGVRPGGKEIVGVEGMSDGTADQLYLAVRLASLEAYLEKNEAMPFIVDDILIKFDDERAIAALQIFAHLAERTQIIFFTHHQHLVELAKSLVNMNVLFIHSLAA